MIKIITQWLARRRYAAAWTSFKMQNRRSTKQRWIHRHLQHHAIFRQNMAAAAALQKQGFRL